MCVMCTAVSDFSLLTEGQTKIRLRVRCAAGLRMLTTMLKAAMTTTAKATALLPQ